MISTTWYKTADKIIRSTVASQLDEYNSTQKFLLPDPARVILGGTNPLSDVSGVKLDEYMNYFDLDHVPEEDFEAEVLSKSLKAAREIAFSVNFLVRKQAQKMPSTQWRDELKRLRATDLFKNADGSQNLKLTFVKNEPTDRNPADPFRLIFGWVSYKFLFACG